VQEARHQWEQDRITEARKKWKHGKTGRHWSSVIRHSNDEFRVTRDEVPVEFSAFVMQNLLDFSHGKK